MKTIRNYDVFNKSKKGLILVGGTKVNRKKEQETPLKGTWISVGVVGVVILAVYLLLYSLYMSRV